MKSLRSSVAVSAKPSKHQLEMEALRAHHEVVMGNRVLRQSTLVDSGVFERAPDGRLTVAKRYESVFVPI
jgi:hypothetical protein